MARNVGRVYFADTSVKKLSKEGTLPAKFKRMLKALDLKERVEGKRVAVKMHVGSGLGYTTIHPLFVRILVDAVREAGGEPFITDGSFSIKEARIRGYTEEVVGAPLVPAAGVADAYFHRRRVDYRGLAHVDLCGNIVDADALIVFSHFKGHGQAAYGGCIKNLGMGAVTVNTRRDIHNVMDMEVKWNEEACRKCMQCVKNCPTGAARFTKEGKFEIFLHHCRFCMHCKIACPEKAIDFSKDSLRYFHEALAIAARETIRCFPRKNLLFINVLMNITPFCDCWGFTTPPVVPDIGIMASKQILPLEKASLDAVDASAFIEGSLPGHLTLGGGSKKHLFERIWGKDPYSQIEAGERVGLGDSSYTIVKVE